jgi:cobalamin biosynthesis protein CobW
VVLTKTDLLDAAAVGAAQAELDRFTRPGVRTVKASFGELPAAVLLGLGAAAEDDVAGRKSVHDGEGEHDHDDFDSFWLEIPEAASPAALVDRLKRVAGRHGILRIKGYAAVAGKPMRLVVQGVGERFGHYFDRAWGPHEAPLGRLVVIGLKGLDQAAIRAEIQAGIAA